MYIVSNPIFVSDYGQYKDIKGVMEALTSRVIELLKVKGQEFLDNINLSYVISNPLFRTHTDEFIDLCTFADAEGLAEIRAKVNEIFSAEPRVLPSYYIKVFYKKSSEGRYEVFRIIRAADHYHGDSRRKNVKNPDSGKKIIHVNKKVSDLVADSEEAIGESIDTAIDELNAALDDEADKVKKAASMISEIRSLFSVK